MSADLVAHVTARDVLEVTGPDARAYLQGQCSQDIDTLEPGDSTEALLLSPQGKVDAYVRITRTGEESYVIDTDAGCGDTARTRLERFRLRTKAAIGTLAWSCLSVRGTPASAIDVPMGPTLVLPVALPEWEGVDLLGPPPDGDPSLTSWLPAGATMTTPEAWEATRIEAGVPVGGREVTESTIAAEAGLVERTVSFTKGCFTGQELVARLDARGSKVARRLWGLVVADGDRPPVGATVSTRDGEHDVGTLTSVAWSEVRGASVALATLHRRIEPPEVVAVHWDGGSTTAEVRPLPLLPT